MSVDAISFSAHADYDQTSGFVAALQPPHVVLVHGEAGEMMRLRSALERASAASGVPRQLHTPKVVQSVSIPAAPRRAAHVVGRLAEGAPKAGDAVRGVLVSRGRRDLVMHPEDLPAFTKLNTGRVMHKQVGRAAGVREVGGRCAAGCVRRGRGQGCGVKQSRGAALDSATQHGFV
jgi:cleavage and polyadenylation specificity factor subunit 3